jgi:alpha-ribazole phosphatase
MPVIDFLRHGATEQPGHLAGRTDIALSEEGWRQFERQTAKGTWSAVVTSPLKRARDAAERLGNGRGVRVEIDPDWSEIDLGDWDGRALAELRADAATAALLAKFYRDPTTAEPPNGESFAVLSARVGRALGRLADQESNALVVAHAGSIRTALSLATGIPMSALWAIRIEPATRVRVGIARHPEHGVWGEIIEVEQP